MKNYVIFLILCCSASGIKAQQNALFSANLYPKISEIKNIDSLNFKFEFVSKSKEGIMFPKQDAWGVFTQGSGYFQIQVQMRKGKRYIDLYSRAHMDNLYELQYETLKVNMSRIFNCSLSGLFQFDSGYYRVRVLSLLSISNNLNNVFTNWCYFHVPVKLEWE
jgi:hypothetical protein